MNRLWEFSSPRTERGADRRLTHRPCQLIDNERGTGAHNLPDPSSSIYYCPAYLNLKALLCMSVKAAAEGLKE